MAILVDRGSRVLIQGITGRMGASFAHRMARFGSPLVAGVAPGRAGQEVAGVPVFDTVEEARRATEADASLIVAPAAAVRGAFAEAVGAGIPLVSVYTEGVPLHDATHMVALARAYGARLVGPNAAGVVSPGQANLSDLSDANLREGIVGLVSKSGTLCYQVVQDLGALGLGQSTIACLGGDPVIGTSYADVLPLFAEDDQTEVVVLLGEIGGGAEMEAARVWKSLGCPKPLIAYVAGWAAAPGKRMGHAGAILGRGGEGAAEKSQALAAAGATVATTVTEVAPLVAAAITP